MKTLTTLIFAAVCSMSSVLIAAEAPIPDTTTQPSAATQPATLVPTTQQAIDAVKAATQPAATQPVAATQPAATTRPAATAPEENNVAANYDLTVGGAIGMSISVGFVTLLFFYCITRVLRESDRVDSSVTIVPPDQHDD